MIDPSEVNELHVSRKTDNSMNVSCKPPDDFNGPETGKYHLRVSIGNNSVGKELQQQKCTFSVEGLQYSTEYTFQVRLPFPHFHNHTLLIYIIVVILQYLNNTNTSAHEALRSNGITL